MAGSQRASIYDELMTILELVEVNTAASRATALSPGSAWPLVAAGLVDEVPRPGRAGHIAGLRINAVGCGVLADWRGGR